MRSKLYWKTKSISTTDESFFLCHVWRCRSCVKTGAITVHPQGAGHDGEIWTVSAATESTTLQCKHGACAGTALTLQPKDTALSQVLNRRQRVGDRAAGAIVCKYKRQHEKEKKTWRTKPHFFFFHLSAQETKEADRYQPTYPFTFQMTYYLESLLCVNSNFVCITILSLLLLLSTDLKTFLNW